MVPFVLSLYCHFSAPDTRTETQTDRAKSHRTGREDIFIHRVIAWFAASENKQIRIQYWEVHNSSIYTLLLLSGYDSLQNKRMKHHLN